MDRREALKSVGLIMGGTIVGSQAFLMACAERETKSELGLLTDQQIALLNEIAETILPKTASTPGAKEVNVGSFMNGIVSDFYDADEQTSFLAGIDELKKLSKEQGGSYEELTIEKKEAIIEQLELAAGQTLKAESIEGEIPHFYIMLKQLAIWGYLSSEAVAFSGFNHMVLTSEFVPCTPITEDIKPMFNDPGQGQAYGLAIHHMRQS